MQQLARRSRRGTGFEPANNLRSALPHLTDLASLAGGNGLGSSSALIGSVMAALRFRHKFHIEPPPRVIGWCRPQMTNSAARNVCKGLLRHGTVWHRALEIGARCILAHFRAAVLVGGSPHRRTSTRHRKQGPVGDAPGDRAQPKRWSRRRNRRKLRAPPRTCLARSVVGWRPGSHGRASEKGCCWKSRRTHRRRP